jgi:vancomycin permeability regulator SanA
MGDMQTKIINKYKKISGFVFHYLIFFVALGVALFIFQRTISQSANINVFQTNDNLLMQKTRLIAEFSKFLKQNVKDNDLEIHILQ